MLNLMFGIIEWRCTGSFISINSKHDLKICTNNFHLSVAQELFPNKYTPKISIFLTLSLTNFSSSNPKPAENNNLSRTIGSTGNLFFTNNHELFIGKRLRLLVLILQKLKIIL